MHENAGIESGRPVKNSGDLGAALRQRRRRLGQTQERLAELVGTHRNQLAELEKGAATERLTLLFDVVNELGLELVIRPRNVHQGIPL